MLIWAAGQEMINVAKDGIGFDNADGFAALAAFRDLRTSGGLLTSASKDWFDPSAIVNEEAVMQDRAVEPAADR